MPQLQITYTSRTGRPISVAAVDDPKLLRAAASTALREARQRIASTHDPVVAKLHCAELVRLTTVLAALEL